MRRLTLAIGVALSLAACATSAPPSPAPEPLATKPCFLVVQGVVTDRAAFQAYVRALPPLYARHGGTYLAAGKPTATLEGAPAAESVVISRWPSCAAAQAFWNDPDYRKLVAMRQNWGKFDVMIIEGLPTATTVAPMAQSPKP
jgi:uncharacterized protein (DUF1330 family)